MLKNTIQKPFVLEDFQDKLFVSRSKFSFDLNDLERPKIESHRKIVGPCSSSNSFFEQLFLGLFIHCKCLQGIAGTLQGNQSAGISNLWGLHVYPQSL